MPQKRKTVYIGMSGGVDSSVSAALLAKAGYKVIGVFIRVWEPAGVPCTWRAERREAMRVAAKLDIPLITLDLSQEYKQGVIDYLVAEYQAGRTPNPDVMCNKQVKFGAFYDWAMKNGADYVATGHYAQIIDGKFARAKDENKDQTYFLWTLKPEQLSHILFPVGKYTKPEVRKLAEKFNLPNAEKRDSQGLCFVGKLDFKDFLKEFIKAKPGEVVDVAGKVIGHHDGAVFYTIGERHGFEVRSQTSNTSPLYVVARDIKNNRLVVASKSSHNKEPRLEQVNWISGEAPKAAKKYQARIRHRGALYACTVEARLSGPVVKFERDYPEAIAPGQSLVLYDNKHCLGGGIITLS